MSISGKADGDGTTWGFLAKVTVTLAGGFLIALPPMIPLAWCASLLFSHPKTVKRLIKDGKLKAHNPTPNKTLIVTESIQELLNSTEVKPSDIVDIDEDDDTDDDTYPLTPPFPRLIRKTA